MKNKLSLLITVAIAISTVGCNNNESSESSSKAETTGVIATSQAESTTNSTDNNFNSSNVSQLDFDFDEAIQNINLFGKKISLPCKFEELGEEFTLESGVPVFESDLLYLLHYKGERIGSVVLKNCNINEKPDDKDIIALDLDNYFIDEQFSVMGIGFNSTRNEILKTFGSPFKQNDMQLYYGLSFDKNVCFMFLDDETEQPSKINIIVKE